MVLRLLRFLECASNGQQLAVGGSPLADESVVGLGFEVLDLNSTRFRIIQHLTLFAWHALERSEVLWF